MNKIVNLKTVEYQSKSGAGSIIVMGLNIPDTETVDEFITECVEKAKLQRMCSPLNTDRLLITLVSTISADRFLMTWKEVVAGDRIMAHFMGQMNKAEVLRGLKAGVTVDSASLI
jgi:hypothetical protein